MLERRRVDDDELLVSAPGEGRGQRRPVGEHDARFRGSHPGLTGRGGARGEPRRDQRQLAAAEARRTGRALDQLAPADSVRAQRQHRLAAGGERGERGDPGAPRRSTSSRSGPTRPRGRRPGRGRAPPRHRGGARTPPQIAPRELGVVIGAGRRRVELAEHDPRLDRAVPLVELEPQRDVERASWPSGEAAVDAEGDPERPPAAASEAEARWRLLAHRPHVGDLRARDQQRDPGLPTPNGPRRASCSATSWPRLSPPTTASTLSLRTRPPPAGLARLGRRTPPGTPRRARPRSRAPPRPGVRRSAPGARRRRRAPPSRSKPGRCAPSRARGPSASSPIRTTGPVVALDHPRGDDPDHPRMPALAGEHQAGGARRVAEGARAGALGARQDLELDLATLAVDPVELGGDLRRPRLVVGEHQLDPGVGAVEAAGGVDPRPEAEGEVALVEPLGASFAAAISARSPGRRARRASASPRRTRARFSPRSATQVGDRRQRDQVELGARPRRPRSAAASL